MSSEPVVPGWLAFDAVEIDTLGHRLYVDGAEVALERKAFAVLVLLAREPGRVFARDEILETLWGHAHVTPVVLNRIITLLRQALGESGGQSRYLHTVHGVGYRFDADVRTSDLRTTPARMALPDIIDPSGSKASAAADAQQRTTDESTAALDHGRPSRTRWLVAVVLAGLLVVAGAWFVRGWHGDDRPVAVQTTPLARGSLIVLPLHAIAGNADDSSFAESLGEELISVLAHVDDLHVIARTSAGLVQSSNEGLATIAARYGITHALEGSVRREGTQLRISLRLFEIASGRTLWSEQYDRTPANIFALQREVADSVAGKFALRLSDETRSALTRTEDPVLYRRYLDARRMIGRRTDNNDLTIATFRKLVTDAPDYGRAHGGLAAALSQTAVLSKEAQERWPQAIAEAERALQLDPSSADATIVLGTAACRNGDWERGIELSRRAIEQAPADTFVRLNYSQCLAMLGYLDQAFEQTQIAQATDPLMPAVDFVAARILDTLGRHDEAARRWGERAPASFQPWFTAIWRGDIASARAHLGQALQGERWFDSYVAVTDAVEDPRKWPAARERIAAADRPDAAFNWVRVLDPEPDIARDVEGLEAIWRNGYSLFSMTLWNRELRSHRAHPAFSAYLQRNDMPAYWKAHGWPDLCRPKGDDIVCV